MEYHSSGSRPRYCPGANSNGGYLCETGHCCGETGCCTYYYELWWFWLLWTVLILFSCCCAYRHRRAKLRVQQQQRQREINLLAYHGATSYPTSMLDLSFLASLKLPSYEEVAAQPSTPPPPYSTVFAAQGGAARYPQPPHHPPGSHPHPSTSAAPSSFSSDNSSSCSCESCCPSSPCSTYETDTSRASTPTTLSQYAAEAAAAVVLETVATVTSSETVVSVSSETEADVAGGNGTGVVADADLSERSTEPARVRYFPGATVETVTVETDVCNVAPLSSRTSPTSTEHPPVATTTGHPLVATTTEHPLVGTACPLTNPGQDRPSPPHSPSPTSAVPSPNILSLLRDTPRPLSTLSTTSSELSPLLSRPVSPTPPIGSLRSLTNKHYVGLKGGFVSLRQDINQLLLILDGPPPSSEPSKTDQDEGGEGGPNPTQGDGPTACCGGASPPPMTEPERNLLQAEARRLATGCQRATRVGWAPEEALRSLSNSFSALVQLSAACLRTHPCPGCDVCRNGGQIQSTDDDGGQEEALDKLKEIVGLYREFVGAVETAGAGAGSGSGGGMGSGDGQGEGEGVRLLAKRCTVLISSVFALTQLFRTHSPDTPGHTPLNF